mmetsp:Transcript_87799/g.268662  ORF Transcript_87799/g.268662 Transcript_87799/m.268662 type:complete len:388 (-) Transcript_87799:243-1406(-)
MAAQEPRKRGGRWKPGEKHVDRHSASEACDLLGSLFLPRSARDSVRPTAPLGKQKAVAKNVRKIVDPRTFPALGEVQAKAPATVSSLPPSTPICVAAVAAVIKTVAGRTLQVLAPRDLEETVWDIKCKLVQQVLVVEERMILLHGTQICSDSVKLSSCICPADHSADGPLTLTLVINAEVPAVRVPNDCNSLSAAVDKLRLTGGVVELAASPSVGHEDVYISRLDINIVALPRSGVDVLGANLHFPRPMHIPYSVKQARLRGLRGLGRVEIDVRSQSWTVLLEQCDIARHGLNYPIVQLHSGTVQCPCLSLCNPRNHFLDVDVRSRGVCSVIVQDCAIVGEQRGIWLVGTKLGHPREVLLRERWQGKPHKCIAERPCGARLGPSMFR